MSNLSAVIIASNPLSKQPEFDKGTSAAKDYLNSEATIAAYTRRPTRGLVLSSDTPASLSIRTATGAGATLLKNSSLVQDGSQENNAEAAWFTTNFLLQAVSTARSEKFQEIETFGPTYGFFFGERPIMITAQAVLLSTPDFPWVVEWWWNYAHGLSGTKLTEANSRVYLEYNEMILEGYILNCQIQETADNPNSVNMTFSMWVTQVDYKIDPGKPYNQEPSSLAAGGYEEMNVQAYGDPGAPVSTGEVVRTKNIGNWLINGGFVQVLRYLRGDTRTMVEQAAITDLASLFLFGRQIVVPRGYLGSEVYAGPAEFATGTGVGGGRLNLLSAAGLPITQVRLPPEFTADTAYAATLRDRPFSANSDEYPYQTRASANSSSLPMDDLNKLFKVTRKSGVSIVYGPGDNQTIFQDTPTQLAGSLDQIAQAQFKLGGITKLYPSISNESGGFIPEWAIKLGRQAYGGVLLAGSAITQKLEQAEPRSDAATANSSGSSTVTLQREAVPPLTLSQNATGDLNPPAILTPR